MSLYDAVGEAGTIDAAVALHLQATLENLSVLVDLIDQIVMAAAGLSDAVPGR